MLVFEITTPGTHLNREKFDDLQNIEEQLLSLKHTFFEANIALNLFTGVFSKTFSTDAETFHQNMERRSEIRRNIKLEWGEANSREEYEKIDLETEIRFKRQKWSTGEPPQQFESNLIYIYAKAFLNAVSLFEKYLKHLSKEANAPEQVKEYHSSFEQAFPNLQLIRNSSQHADERSRGIGKGGKPLDLKPIRRIDDEAENPGLFLIIDSLSGTRLGCTLHDGNYGEIDVSPQSMQDLRAILTGVLHSFEWTGPARHEPSF